MNLGGEVIADVHFLFGRASLPVPEIVKSILQWGGVLRDRRLWDSSRAIRSNTRSIYI